MVPELGLFLLIIAAVASLLSIGAGFKHAPLVQMRSLRLTAILVFSAFALLMISFYQVDLSLQIVYQHADHALPTPYRIGAVWGGHEGSMLLWVAILNVWAILATFLKLPDDIKRNVFTVLSSVNIGFLLYILIVSNPFARYLPITPTSGQDLNPFLQDPVMLIHPPILYMGYLGFIVPYALAIAVLIKGKCEPEILDIMRRCALRSWSFLTLGICLGSFWAYYELGWGGWWFWDPVENASLMPWLAGCALLHVVRVAQHRQGFVGWTVLLCIFAFCLSILGTFLVRSGALTSVHSFANDPTRGLFVLGLLTIYTVPALLLFSIKSVRLHQKIAFPVTSREGFILMNNVLFMIVLCTVILGTLYPLVIESLGLGFISVGAPYFNYLIVPIGLVLAIGILFAPFTRYIKSYEWPKNPLKNLASASIGMHLAHVGFLSLCLGIAVTSYYSIEDDVVMSVGQTHTMGNYDFTLDSVSPIKGPNFTAAQAVLSVQHKGKHLAIMKPEKRYYAPRNMPIAEIALKGNLMRDLYVALAEPIGNDRWVIRIQIKPMIRFIWLGGILMTLGGFVAYFSRRGKRK